MLLWRRRRKSIPAIILLITGVVVCIIIAAGLLWPRPSTQALAPTTPGVQTNLLATGNQRQQLSDFPSLPITHPDTLPPDGLAMDAQRHLVINPALHLIFDYFLLGGHPGPRSNHIFLLQSHLKEKLPEPAISEALHVLDSYLHYLQEHDKLLERVSAEPGAEPEPEKIRSWIAQRARLRQNVLGVEVTKIWFADEDAEMQRALLALSQADSAKTRDQAAPGGDSLQYAGDRLNQLREQGASPAQEQAVVAEQFGDAAALRLEKFQREDQVWQARLTAFQRAAAALRKQTGQDPNQRERQLQALLTSSFPLEEERLRARAQSGLLEN
jgi:lipase chaperone LimK